MASSSELCSLRAGHGGACAMFSSLTERDAHAVQTEAQSLRGAIGVSRIAPETEDCSRVPAQGEQKATRKALALLKDHSNIGKESALALVPSSHSSCPPSPTSASLVPISRVPMVASASAPGALETAAPAPSSPDLPDDCMLSILSLMPRTKDRNAFALASRRCFDLEATSRTSLHLGPGLHPATEALGKLAGRFTALRSIHFDYLGWKSSSGPQLGDDALGLVVSRCPGLENLALSFCGFVTDTGMAHLAHCATLRSLRLNFTPCITGRGLLSLVLGCPQLEALHVERCMGLRSSEWLEALGNRRHAQDSAISSAPTSPIQRMLQSPLADSGVPAAASIPSHFGSQGPQGIASTASTSAAGTSKIPRSFLSPGRLSSQSPSTSNSTPSTGSPLDSSDLTLFNSPQTPPPLALSPGPFSLISGPQSGPRNSGLLTPQGTASSTAWWGRLPHSHRPAPVGVKRLTISHCRGIGEGDLAKLGKAGWERLEELTFDMDLHPRDVLLPSVAPFEQFAQDLDLSRMRVLRISNCPRVRGEGLALILNRLCSGKLQHEKRRRAQGKTAHKGSDPSAWCLEELRLVSCPGLNDADVREILGCFSASLKVLHLSLVKWLGGTAVHAAAMGVTGTTAQDGGAMAGAGHPHQASTWAVTTASLWYISDYCNGLEELELICRDDFPSSAPLFEGFADAAVSGVVANLPSLRRLTVGRGLHLSQKLITEFKEQHPQVSLRVVDNK